MRTSLQEFMEEKTYPQKLNAAMEKCTDKELQIQVFICGEVSPKFPARASI